jgi:hypothetical protein
MNGSLKRSMSQILREERKIATSHDMSCGCGVCENVNERARHRCQCSVCQPEDV